MVNQAIDNGTQMRDAVIDRLYALSGQDRDIMFFTADMGAQSLDKWRKDREDQYRDVGIAEQAMISIASGMAREGKRVFIYAIAPFVTTRIHEFHKLNAGVQKLPYNTIGVGTGFSYSDSGPTHYNTEDIAIMRVIPNMEILSPSDSVMAASLAEYACYSHNPTYLRLERSVLPILSRDSESFNRGFRVMAEGEDACIISTGGMVHRALEAQEKLLEDGKVLGVIDLYRIKPLNLGELQSALKGYKRIITLEEHLLAGGLGSLIGEMVIDNRLALRVQRIGINDRLVYYYGRDNIQKQLGLDLDSIIDKINTTD